MARCHSSGAHMIYHWASVHRSYHKCIYICRYWLFVLKVGSRVLNLGPDPSHTLSVHLQLRSGQL